MYLSHHLNVPVFIFEHVLYHEISLELLPYRYVIKQCVANGFQIPYLSTSKSQWFNYFEGSVAPKDGGGIIL